MAKSLFTMAVEALFGGQEPEQSRPPSPRYQSHYRNYTMLPPKQEAALTQLAEQVSYNPNTGEFKWRTAGRGRNVHSPAGSTDHNGYLKLSTNVDGKRVDVKAARLAVFIMSLDNHCPPLQADTKVKFADGDRSNTKWDNLQLFGPVD